MKIDRFCFIIAFNLIKMNKYLFLFIIILSVSCNRKKENPGLTNYTISGDTIILTPNSIHKDKLKTATVKPEEYRTRLAISGIIKAIPNNYAEVASPFAGRITRSFVKLGQQVEVDAPIFEISSPSFFEAGKAYYQSNQEMQLAEKNLKRQQDLYKNGVGTQKDLEEAEVHFELTRRDFENAVASLEVYHVNTMDLVLGQPLIVRSPIKGEIVENNIVLGQYLREDADPVAIVAELSKVWVIGQLKEKDMNSVNVSDEAEIYLTGMPKTPIIGNVFHIGEIMDEVTRSVRIYVLCNNMDHIMKPGMYVTTEFSKKIDNAILIPATAVFQMEETSFVFLHHGDNKYTRERIETDGTDGNRVFIRSGISPNDEIVTGGGNLLLEIRN